MILSVDQRRAVTIAPVQDIERVGAANSPAWRVVGEAPQWSMALAGPLRAGTYRLAFSSYVSDGSDAIELFLDTGKGFAERPSQVAYLVRRGSRCETVFALPPDVNGIRFGPHPGTGQVELGKVQLNRISTTAYRMGRAASVVWGRLNSAEQVASMMQRALAIVRAGGARALLRSVQDVVLREIGRGPNLGYGDWIARYDTLSGRDLVQMTSLIETMAYTPKISILLPVYNAPREFLVAAIESVTSQVYENWELCIADDASTAPHVREVLNSFSTKDARIKVAYRAQNGHISKSSNTALDLASGDWITLLDHDDALRPHSLYELAVAINRNGNAKLIYSDEDKLDEDGKRCDPYFKPDWNYELFLSQNLITHMAAIRADIMRAVGGFRTGFEGAQDYDLFLRVVEQCALGEIVHIPKILYHWRRLVGSTALSSGEKPYAMLAGERALNEHLQRMGDVGMAELIGFGFRTRYQLPTPLPLVSIIIPTRDRLDLLKACVLSIFEKTTYDAYEILIVDNNSSEQATLAWLAEIGLNRQVRVIRDERDFNYSRLNNLAASQASGDFLLLLNNDVEVISAGWLDEMVGVCSQPGVGAVGGCLWYPDNTMQHGGVIMGLGGLAAHAHDRLPKGNAGYVGRAALRHEVSAVTGACMLTRRVAYDAVGGLDEVDLKIAYNDIDYCLKLRAAGWRIVWTPFAELYHFESASRGYEISPEKKARFEAEKAAMRRRWASWIDHDPSYNPNLTLDDARFSLGFPPRSERFTDQASLSAVANSA